MCLAKQHLVTHAHTHIYLRMQSDPQADTEIATASSPSF
eukprot:COSAG06_NODE_2120_length_7543_cov_14.316497_6_plen_39_part_00